MTGSPRETVVVLDYGSQYNQLIVRRLRECGVFSELLPSEVPWEEIEARRPRGVILSGGPASVYAPGAPGLPPELLRSGIPVLGICYGMQLLAHALGGKVLPGIVREYGEAHLEILVPSPLFNGINGGVNGEVNGSAVCWMSHGDEVAAPPPGFEVLARSERSASSGGSGNPSRQDGGSGNPSRQDGGSGNPSRYDERSGALVAAIGDPTRRWFGVQFHPEVTHTTFGTRLLRNFLGICGCEGSWTPRAFVDEAVEEVRAVVGRGRALLALSGGVDSTVAAILVHRAIGDQLSCVFVDNGLLREGEEEEVRRLCGEAGISLSVAPAADRFLRRLAGVADPEEKRRRIGHEFIDVFEEEAEKLGKIDFLVQGTLYPDVVESRGAHKTGALIKTHHNVGGLPERMKLRLVEPFRLLFKDEVRRVGEVLGLPAAVIHRQPFPGPGLAVRIVGEVTAERLALLRRADAIVRRECEAAEHEAPLWQYFAVLLPVRSVGVMGDERSYGLTVAIRAVTSQDGMTADWGRLSHDLLGRMANRIVNEVPDVNRVVYDLTSKPPGTIEWE